MAPPVALQASYGCLPPPPPPPTPPLPPRSAVTVTAAVALPGLDATTPLIGAAFAADGAAVAAVGDAKTVWLWRLTRGEGGGGGAPASAVLAAEWCVFVPRFLFFSRFVVVFFCSRGDPPHAGACARAAGWGARGKRIWAGAWVGGQRPPCCHPTTAPPLGPPKQQPATPRRRRVRKAGRRVATRCRDAGH